MITLVVGLGGSGALMDGVVEHGNLSLLDPSVTMAFRADRTPSLTGLAEAMTFLGSVSVLAPLTILTVTLLVLLRRRFLAAAVAGGMALSLTLTVILKALVGRTRPAAIDVLGPIDRGFAFPSGHTLNSTVFYGLIAGMVVLVARRTWIRAVIAVGWLAVALGVGTSRIYLGYHWMTDVLAGWVLGITVLSTVLLVTSWMWKRRQPHPSTGIAASGDGSGFH